MFKRSLAALVVTGAMVASTGVYAEGGGKAMIAPGLFSFMIQHDGEPIEVMRNQSKDNRISELYATTFRGMPQPMHPFAPHKVETLGEREFVDYMMQADKSDDVMVVDTRTVGWHERLTIPGAVNFPYTMMKDAEERDWALDEFGAKKASDGTYDFSGAKTLAMFCNGYWCGQTPAMVRAMLELGYPAAKIKYYRGGMQAWTSLGFTVVGEAAE